MSNIFVVSDESKNSYGFTILTDGINTEPFERNPVMFYMHNREKGIVGRWDNIRKEGKQLLADAVFDDSTELGVQVKKQVENGFLRCASIGVENVVKESLNGVETVVKCDLKEISIVDIPSNGNAVKLYKKGGKCVYKLCDLDTMQDSDLRTQILSLLGLADDATDNNVLDAIKSLLKSPENVDAEIDNAVLAGYIDATQRTNFKAMAVANKTAFLSFIATKRKEKEPEIIRMVSEAAGKGKLIFQDSYIYENIGNKLGINALCDLLNSLPSAIKPNDVIRLNNNRSNWTLSDYRKFAPDELRGNPSLYAQLIEKEGGVVENTNTLDYYRRHNPEYLQEHPEVYQRLLKKDNINH